jgi:hypothetical protein
MKFNKPKTIQIKVNNPNRKCQNRTKINHYPKNTKITQTSAQNVNVH